MKERKILFYNNWTLNKLKKKRFYYKKNNKKDNYYKKRNNKKDNYYKKNN